ncbi:Replication-relaxation [Frankineae bacterium MT45]|nr:Replication-relaxation [Frankineae bacterium MT45]
MNRSEGVSAEGSGMTGTSRRRGLGAERLLDLQRQLSARDLRLLELVAAHRFLTTRHIEQFLFHDHATQTSGARSCRRSLARLESWQLVERPIRRVGGMQAGSASSIWMLASPGHRLLNLRAGNGAVGRVREPGERFIRHYLAIADTHLTLVTAERSSQLELSTVEIEPLCWRSHVGLGGQREVLKPDLFAVTAPRTDGLPAEFEDSWFIEVDRATESLPTVVKQCEQYEAYRRTGIEQDQRGVFPLVLWVVPDERRATGLRTAIQRSKKLDTDLYRITTPEQFLAVILRGAA